MQELDKKFYRIGDVSEILGIPESTLRYWESQFTIIKPKRNKKNIRKLDAAQAQIRHNRDGVDKRFDAIVQLKSIRDQLVIFQNTLDELFPDVPAQR